MTYKTGKFLTFAFDVELNDDDFIPANTQVEIYSGLQRSDSTKIIYNNNVVEFMNYSFIEFK